MYLPLGTYSPDIKLGLVSASRNCFPRALSEERTRRLRLERDVTADVPVFVFSAGDSAPDITVLPYDRLRQAPLDRIDEKPMRRANLAAVEELVRNGNAPDA